MKHVQGNDYKNNCKQIEGENKANCKFEDNQVECYRRKTNMHGVKDERFHGAFRQDFQEYLTDDIARDNANYETPGEQGITFSPNHFQGVPGAGLEPARAMPRGF